MVICFYLPPPGRQLRRSQAVRLAQIAVLARSKRMKVFGILPQIDLLISMFSLDGCRWRGPPDVGGEALRGHSAWC